MKTANLTGVALDWAVAKCEMLNGADYTLAVDKDIDDTLRINFGGMYPEWATDWQESGEIIQREKIAITGTNFPWWECDDGWYAHIGDCYSHGATPLEAAMRCYVASKLGDEVELPEGLTHE